MISDRYILKPYPDDIDRVLGITEHMAACYGFNAKELLLIRLITEEMILSVRTGLLLTPGELWFSTSDGMFVITASVGTDVYGLPKEQREKLLQLADKPKKSGLFGFIQDFIENMALANEPINLQGYIDGRNSGAVNIGPGEWRLEEGACFKGTGDDADDISTEINLLKGFADDTRIESDNKRIKLSVMKKIHFNYLFDYISNATEKHGK